jgi:methylated-DNA-[protein]-cysteine S-methyltransferase
LRQLSFVNGRHTRGVAREWVRDDKPFQEVVRQLRAYFRGELKQFDLRLEMRGTEFQKSVWEELRKIPYGETRSYGQVAEIIGNPKAMRAVGAANGQNPIAIIVPCHRVIGSSGSLTGFGGGMDCKKRLLELEKGQITLL